MTACSTESRLSGLAQRSRPSAHVGWTGFFCPGEGKGIKLHEICLACDKNVNFSTLLLTVLKHRAIVEPCPGGRGTGIKTSAPATPEAPVDPFRAMIGGLTYVTACCFS